MLRFGLQTLSIEDPEALRRADAAKPEDRPKLLSDAYERLLSRKVDSIRQIGDLRRALLLQDWPQGEFREVEEFSAVARRVRAQLARRFQEAVGQVLKEGDQTARLAAMNMLAELGATVFRPEPATAKESPAKEIKRLRAQTPAGEGLVPDLADIVLHGKTREDRLAAAYALGQILPDPKIAVPALRSMLGSADVVERRAAAGGLNGMVRVVSELAAKGLSTTGPQLERGEIVTAGSAVVPAVGPGLADSDVLVRRLCAEALELMAAALNSQVPQPQPTEDPVELEGFRQVIDQAQAELMPLMRAFKEQGANMGGAVLDPDAGVRLRGRRAMEELGSARQRFLVVPRPAGQRPAQGANRIHSNGSIVLVAAQNEPTVRPDDPLLDVLTGALPALVRGLQDPITENRLAALDAIETIGRPAAPAAPALVRAFRDPDRFVRWAAARTMGKVGPVDPRVEVPALARLLEDADVDVFRSAAVALERYGPLAADAVPALIRALKADHWVMRIQAIESLETVGTGAASAIPGLAGSLSDSDARVRRYAADVLGRFGPMAKEAIPALTAALGDSNGDVRKAASDALLNITVATKR
jgi:HEAT repeat protein